MKKTLTLGGLLFIVISIVAGLSIYFGFVVGYERDSLLYWKLNRLSQLIYQFTGDSGDGSEGAVSSSSIDSTLLTLHMRSKKMSNARSDFDGRWDNTGGALDIYHAQVLFMDPKGVFYLGDDLENFKTLDITAPKTNHKRYKQYDGDPAYSNASFQHTPLKYNDVKYVELDETNRILISYTEFDDVEPCFRNIVAYLDLQPGVPLDTVSVDEDDWQPLYKSEPCLPLMESGWTMYGEMAGGMIEVIDSNSIFYVNGDFLYKDIAQNPDADYGKVMKINMNSGEAEIFGSGLRNPKGLEIDAEGKLWSIENGPRGGDELNVVKQGGNYGWPIESYGTEYTGAPTNFSKTFGRHDAYLKPAFSWLPSIAPSEVIQVNNFHQYWDRDLLVTSLRAETLFRLGVDGERVVFAEPIHIGERIRDIVQYGEKLVMLTDSMNLIFVTVEPIQVYESLISSYTKTFNEAEANRVQANIALCQECHAFYGNDNSRAPNLHRVYGDPVGSTDFQGYTSAMQQKGGEWDEATLRQFILDPQQVVPGSSMPNPGLQSEEDVDNIIGFLKYLDSTK